jgi:hypothetical protein
MRQQFVWFSIPLVAAAAIVLFFYLPSRNAAPAVVEPRPAMAQKTSPNIAPVEAEPAPAEVQTVQPTIKKLTTMRTSPPTVTPGPNPTPTPAPASNEVKWQVVFKDTFDTADSVKKYVHLQSGKIQWHEKYKAMLLLNEPQGEIFAAIPASLPGDLRVRFRALRSKSSSDVSIGLFFSLNGRMREMKGYFAEWARGIAQLKRMLVVQQEGKAPTPQTPERWVNIELLRVGPKVTLSMENSELLAYDDPDPLYSAQHDLMSFYIWNESTIIDDLVIERNINDKIKPKPENPATLENMTEGKREHKPVIEETGTF